MNTYVYATSAYSIHRGDPCAQVSLLPALMLTQSRPGLWISVSVSVSASMSTGERVCFIKFLEAPAALSALLCSAGERVVCSLKHHKLHACFLPHASCVYALKLNLPTSRVPVRQSAAYSSRHTLLHWYAYVKVSLPWLLLCCLFCLPFTCYHLESGVRGKKSGPVHGYDYYINVCWLYKSANGKILMSEFYSWSANAMRRADCNGLSGEATDGYTNTCTQIQIQLMCVGKLRGV